MSTERGGDLRGRYRYWVFLGMLLLFFPVPVKALGDALLILSKEGGIYAEVAAGVEERLRRGTGSRSLRVTRATAGRGANSWTSGSPDLLIPIGLQACKKVREQVAQVPVLCVLVPKFGFDEIRRSARTADRASMSAIYLDQPLERQFALARILLPRGRRAGILVGPQLQRAAREIREAAAAHGFEADLREVSDESDVVLAIEQLVVATDLIVAIYDPVSFTPTTAKWLLHLAYQQKVPVVGFSRAYVRAGAVAAVFSSPRQIGRDAADVASAFLRRGARRLPPPAHPRYFGLEINEPVADSLGLSMPSEKEILTRLHRREGDELAP